MITFDALEKPEFLESLNVLGQDVADAVLNHLEDVASTLGWDDFVEDYAWRPLVLLPVETYPGADPLFVFTVPLPEGMRPPDDLVDVYCQLYPNVVVICAVANIPKPVLPG